MVKKLYGFWLQKQPFELTAKHFSRIEQAGHVRLGSEAQGQLAEWLMRYERDLAFWKAAPRGKEMREILAPINAAAEVLRQKLERLLSGGSEAQEIAINKLTPFINVVFLDVDPRDFVGCGRTTTLVPADLSTWLDDTLLRVTALQRLASQGISKLSPDHGGIEGDPFLPGLIRNLRTLFEASGGQDVRRFGREQRELFIPFVEEALTCVPGHSPIADLAKAVERALKEAADIPSD